ncbi:transposase [Pseudomonas hefeiensis]
MVLDGILWGAFFSAAWRDMPERFGPWLSTPVEN